MVTHDVTNDVTTRRPGRPRSAQAHQAILDATVALLIEEGYEGLTMEAVAARAGVGKATIYRRWPAKEELVIEAIEGLRAETPLPDTGNLRQDLLTVYHGSLRLMDDSRISLLTTRMIGEIAVDPRVVKAFRATLVEPRMHMMYGLIQRAQERGEVRADVDPVLAVEVFFGPLLYRLLITRHLHPTPPDYPEQLTDAVLRGLGA